MSRGKIGSKANRAEANAAYQRQLRERNRLRRERRAENEAKYGIATPVPKTSEQIDRDYYAVLTVPELREIVRAIPVKVTSRMKKADLISAILENTA